MCWWTNALYDTCSLISLDYLLLEHPGVEPHFCGVRALEASFAAGQMRADAADRIRARATIVALPDPHNLAHIFCRYPPSVALSDMEKLLFAAAIHHETAVVTRDSRLARSIRDASLVVGNIAVILRELVTTEIVARIRCEAILQALVRRSDLMLGTHEPTWDDLEKHCFPD
ncbi:hypothetical protein [Tautonia plasticadhaerens]|uniref:PIN domain-containing protein n=1 Tax=Tautonia plasticadhaerens TaxID=2527974 RepID=A0A518HET0_9BACT|nr:hypothetical protein [Tautonia plasticadhaerens]QDV39276.1 hypothetical protein ElP_72400 [Tautonia plasticadhaerens]